MTQDLFSGLPPELWAEYQRLQRRNALAQQLSQQALSPLAAPQVKGRFEVPVSPLQGAAQLLKAYTGSKIAEQGESQMAELGKRYQTGLADAIRQYSAAKSGVPASSETIMDETANQGEGAMATINAPAREGDPRGAVVRAMTSPYGAVRELGKMDYAQMGKSPTHIDLGDKVLVMQGGQVIGTLPKSATPDTLRREEGAAARHAAPSGSALLGEQGAMARHQTPSGSAQLSAQTTLQTHATPSGSAQLAAKTAIRGQDLTDTRQREANALRAQEVNMHYTKLVNELQAAGAKNAGALASYRIANESLDRLTKHPGLSEAVGVGWEKTAIPFVGPIIPGTNRANFVTELESFKSQAFLPMVENLRGMGALSDAEGKKLENAVGALSTNMSEKAFLESVARIKADLEAARTRVQGAAPIMPRTAPQPSFAGPAQPGAVLKFDAQGNQIQ